MFIAFNEPVLVYQLSIGKNPVIIVNKLFKNALVVKAMSHFDRALLFDVAFAIKAFFFAISGTLSLKYRSM